MRNRFITVMTSALAAAALAACGGSGGTQPAQTDVGSGTLQGAGSTFVEPFFTKAFYAYNQKYPGVSVNYQAVGSGAGIQQYTKGTVQFGASDVPMTDAEVTAAGGAGTLVEIPSTLGVVAIAFNVPGVDRLNLDGPTLAGIFLGTIKRWDDPALKALNSGVSLPGKDINVVHRSDGSGTTYAFTDYLSKVSPDWKSKVGTSKSVQWPAGVGASGNQGVGQGIKSTDNSIGYVELAYVVQTGLKRAAVKNQAGKFVQASVEGATAAAATNTSVSPANFSIVNATGDTSYPISTFSWVILKKDQGTNAAQGKALVYLFKWLVTDGQAQGKDLQYAALPSAVQNYAIGQLKTITSGGKAILT